MSCGMRPLTYVCVVQSHYGDRGRERESKGAAFLDIGMKHMKADCFDVIGRERKGDMESASTAWCGCQRDQETNRREHGTILAKNCLSGAN